MPKFGSSLERVFSYSVPFIRGTIKNMVVTSIEIDCLSLQCRMASHGRGSCHMLLHVILNYNVTLENIFHRILTTYIH